jgi:hypothetical protein
MQDSREEHAKLSADISALRRLKRQVAEELLNTLSTHRRLAEQAMAEGDAASA